MHDHAHHHGHHAVRGSRVPTAGELVQTMEGPHRHVFLGESHERNERRTWAVIALTTAMMVAETVAGTVYGSMALVADGWHMATHAGALMITALSYRFARRHADDPRFTFGTGKVGDLAGFASAVALALVAVLIGWEGAQRLLSPVAIDFDQAMVVAVIGLAVNLASAALLHQRHDHVHHDGDSNLRAAYLHVMADALTSVLAIVALLAGRLLGWVWLDPVMGVLGALVILRWSVGLMSDSGAVLVDRLPEGPGLPEEIRTALETGGDRITDLHVWRLGPGSYGAIVALTSDNPLPPGSIRARLAHLDGLAHVTVEVCKPPGQG